MSVMESDCHASERKMSTTNQLVYSVASQMQFTHLPFLPSLLLLLGQWHIKASIQLVCRSMLALLQSPFPDVLVIGTGRNRLTHGPHPTKGHVDLALLLPFAFLLAALLLFVATTATTGSAGAESTTHPQRLVVIVHHGIVLPRHGPRLGPAGMHLHTAPT